MSASSYRGDKGDAKNLTKITQLMDVALERESCHRTPGPLYLATTELRIDKSST